MCLIKLVFYLLVLVMVVYGAFHVISTAFDRFVPAGVLPSFGGPDVADPLQESAGAVRTAALPWASRAREAVVGVTTLEQFYDLMLPGVQLASGRRRSGYGTVGSETFYVEWVFPDASFVGAGFSPGQDALLLRRVAVDPRTLVTYP